jgi:hypothetical protein
MGPHADLHTKHMQSTVTVAATAGAGADAGATNGGSTVFVMQHR